MEAKRHSRIKHLKLVIPLVLALVLLPTSAFAEEGKEKTDQYKALREFQEKMDSESRLTKDGNSAEEGNKDPLSAPAAKERMAGYAEERRLRLQQEYEEKGPWYKRVLQSFGMELEDKYIYQLPTPNTLATYLDKFEDRRGKYMKVNETNLPWKYIGERMVDGEKKYIWVTAVQAKGQKEIDSFLLTEFNMTEKYAIYMYGSKEDIEHSGFWRMTHHWYDTLNTDYDGDMVIIELHLSRDDINPIDYPFFAIDRYRYSYYNIEGKLMLPITSLVDIFDSK